MMRLHLTKRVGFVLKASALAAERLPRHITSKHRSIIVRNIAVLTEDLKNEAERNSLKSVDSMPGPRTFPFFGNLDYIKTDFLNMHITQLNYAKTYGPMYKDQIFGTPIVVVQDPDICKEVYRAEGKLPQRDFSLAFGEFMKERDKLQMPKSLIQL